MYLLYTTWTSDFEFQLKFQNTKHKTHFLALGFGIDSEVTREGKDKRERERERYSLQYFTVISDLKVHVQLRSVQLSVTHNSRQSHQSHKQ